MATAKENKDALAEQAARGDVLNPVGAVDDQTPHDKVPTNDEPPIPLAPGTFDERTFSYERDGMREASPRTIMPPEPQPVAVASTRTLTDEDLNSVGYRCLNGSAKANVETMILRPGDRVAGAVDVYPIDDVSDGARITLMAGAVVPQEAAGYLPAHYMVEPQRKALGGKR